MGWGKKRFANAYVGIRYLYQRIVRVLFCEILNGKLLDHITANCFLMVSSNFFPSFLASSAYAFLKSSRNDWWWSARIWVMVIIFPFSLQVMVRLRSDCPDSDGEVFAYHETSRFSTSWWVLKQDDWPGRHISLFNYSKVLCNSGGD